jgi:hypothetical protein
MTRRIRVAHKDVWPPGFECFQCVGNRSGRPYFRAALMQDHAQKLSRLNIVIDDEHTQAV